MKPPSSVLLSSLLQSLQELAPGGRGRDWGEVVSLPVPVLLQPQGAAWEQREEGCTSFSTWKQTAHSEQTYSFSGRS